MHIISPVEEYPSREPVKEHLQQEIGKSDARIDCYDRIWSQHEGLAHISVAIEKEEKSQKQIGLQHQEYLKANLIGRFRNLGYMLMGNEEEVLGLPGDELSGL